MRTPRLASPTLLAGAVLLVLAGRPATALADTSPTSGVAQLMVVEAGDASYRLFHGAVWLDSDKASTNYRWGGLQCKGREIGAASLELLMLAMRTDYQVTLEYVASQLESETYRCVTAVTLSK